MTQPKEAQLRVGFQFRIAVVVASAVLWVRKLADFRTMELFFRCRRPVGYRQSKSRRFGPYRTSSDSAGFCQWMKVSKPQTRFVFRAECTCTSVVAVTVVWVREQTFLIALEFLGGNIGGDLLCPQGQYLYMKNERLEL